MKSQLLRTKIGRILLTLAFITSIGLVSSSAVQAQQWPYGRDRDYGRDDRNGRGADQWARDQGYQDGIYTGSRDAQKGQSYDPQRSHFYRNGHGDNGNFNHNRYSEQAYRNGFLQGYQEGYRRYGGNRRNGNNGNYRRYPYPF